MSEYEHDVVENSYNAATNGGQNMSALRTRLDTRPLIEDLEMYLSGTGVQVVRTENGLVENRKQMSKAKANATGIHAILSYVGMTLNSQIVQGNFDVKEEMSEYIYQYEVNLARILMTNLKKWDISDDDFAAIVDTIVNAIHPFITRLYKNKERESYGVTMRTVESSTVNEGGNNKSGINFFGGRK